MAVPSPLAPCPPRPPLCPASPRPPAPSRARQPRPRRRSDRSHMTRAALIRSLRTGAMLAAFVLLSGCQVANMVSGWFESNGKKSNLRGVRISVGSLDNSLMPDPTIQGTRVLLPTPYRNREWPDPGGYSSNTMYHLEATGPLRQVWSADAGKGSNRDSRLTAPPIVAGGYV